MTEGHAETQEQKKARMLQPLKIVHTGNGYPAAPSGLRREDYLLAISNLIVAQSNLIRNTKHDKAWTHYVALCKEFERVAGITYAPYEGD